MRHYRYKQWPSHVKGRFAGIYKEIGERTPDRVDWFAPEEWAHNWKREARWKNFQVQAHSRELNMLFGTQRGCKEQTERCPDGANIIHWPTFWISATVDQTQYAEFPRQGKITKAFMSLNGQPHIHRCMIMDELVRRKMHKHAVMTWHYPNVDWDWKAWKPELLEIEPNWNRDSADSFKYSTFMHSALSSSFMNLIAESQADIPFLTEKTFQQIIYKRPFLTMAGAGIYKDMDKLGFKRYDEIFDYSFDEVEDSMERGLMIIDQVESIIGKNYEAMNRKIMPKLEYNYQRARALANDPSYVPDIVKEMIRWNPKFSPPYVRFLQGVT